MNKMPRNVKRAIVKYGQLALLNAYYQNRVIGNGASTIGYMYGTNTNGADAMITAGEWLFNSGVDMPKNIG